MWNTTIVYFILMGILGASTFNEKRYRYYTILPVTPQDVAIADGLCVLLVQLGMSVLWIWFLLFRPENLGKETLWVIVANDAVIQIVVTLFGIHYHAGFFERKKYKRLNWLFLLTLVAAVALHSYFRNLRPIARAAWRHYTSAPGAFVLVLVWIAVLALYREVYLRRKSYLA
jgi:hypothetical protein